jgi:hypothetical protein
MIQIIWWWDVSETCFCDDLRFIGEWFESTTINDAIVYVQDLDDNFFRMVWWVW